MGIFDKLPFFKKKEDPLAALGKQNFDMPPLEKSEPFAHQRADSSFNPLQENTAAGSFNHHDFNMEAPSPTFDPVQQNNSQTSAFGYSGQNVQQHYPQIHQPVQQARQHAFKSEEDRLSKDIELISTKIDYLRATIENISQRLANIERLAEQEYQKKNTW
ncbi:hypothetical protein JW930_06685 [Candidatus Woesearchaeota archaeon]|nr:hypothetical protein [Candidatus Woesearchaeota archaeon]